MGPYHGIHNCLWLKYPAEFNKSMLANGLSNQPPSYSAAVSKDILTNKGKNDMTICGLRNNCIENVKPGKLSIFIF